MSNRDDFTSKTINILAKRAAWLCSNPDCRKPTVGAKSGSEGVIILGEAAHITAAAPGGPRYNPTLSSAERKDISNGIWLCNTCAALIDRDEAAFPTSMLYEWKKDAEGRSFAALAGSCSVAHLAKMIPVELGEADIELIRSLGFPNDEEIEAVTAKLRTAAQKDIEAFKRERSWPGHLVSLNMIIMDSCGTHVLSCENVAAAMEVANEVSIIADPGTGKTTSMVQIADTILRSDGGVAIVIPLAEWSSRPETFFQSLTHRNAFRSFREQHFMLLACHGRLLLILDGWNELDSTSRSRVYSDIKALRREFPLLRVAISTRRQMENLPISGPSMKIAALTEEQQLEIACALRGEEGAALLEQAWQTEGVRELLSIPLYFNSLFSYATCGTMPTSKEEVLRLFVQEHEKEPSRAEVLKRILFGCHRDILIGLAAEAMSSNNTIIKDARARAVVSEVEGNLVKAGQIATRPEPLNVLDVLVDQHLLVRLGSDGGVSFQHQQFQEWYASVYVGELMLASSAGNTDALNDLRNNVLNMPFWEESVLFACERLSGLDTAAVRAVGHTILQCIAIDPMLAAEMIHRSSSPVWDLIKGDIQSFISRWHKPGKVDRALGFMITTGKPEFSELVSSLVLNPDTQVHLRALRFASQFRTSVLGGNIKEKIAALPEETRESIMAEIVMRSDITGILLACDFAKNETSPKVQLAVIEYLLFRGIQRLASTILKVSPPPVWQMLACTGYVNAIDDVEVTQRLKREYQSYIQNESNPLKKLKLLLDAENSPDIAKQIEELIISDQFPVKNNDAYWALVNAEARYPSATIRAVLFRIETGREVPFGTKALLKGAAFIDEGPIVNLVTVEENLLADIAAVVVGPKTVGVLIGKLLELNDNYKKGQLKLDEEIIREQGRIKRRICDSHPSAFLSAVECYKGTVDPDCIGILADLLDRHGQYEENGLLNVNDAFKEPLTRMINQWIEVLLGTPSATRQDYSELARVITRFPTPEFLDGLHLLLIQDLARSKTEQRTMNYTNLYGNAFSAIGDDRVVELMFGYLKDMQFGIQAAYVLKRIWDKRQNIYENKPPREWPNFRQAARFRRQRQIGGVTVPSPFAEVIFETIKDMIQASSSTAECRHIIKLAQIALSMPHGDKTSTFENLLALPIPLWEKFEFVAAQVAAGYEIKADLVIQGLRDLLEEAKQNRWLLDVQPNRIGNWLMLIPFSDRPETLRDAYQLVKDHIKEQWQIQQLLSALAYAPTMQAEAALFELAEDTPQFYGEYEWLEAVIRRNTVSSALRLVDLMYDAKLFGNEHRLDSRTLAQKVSGLFESHPNAQSELIHCYRSASPDVRARIEPIIAELADEDGLLTLVSGYSDTGRKFDWQLEKMIDNIALGKMPVGSHAFQYFSKDVSSLRKKLLAMVNKGEAAANIAASCLVKIDELRDKYGRVDTEPRHPDIESGLPWPPEAAVH